MLVLIYISSRYCPCHLGFSLRIAVAKNVKGGKTTASLSPTDKSNFIELKRFGHKNGVDFDSVD